GLSVALGSLISYIAISHAVTSSLDNDLRQKTAIISNSFLPSYILSPNQQEEIAASNALVVTDARVTVVLSDGEAIVPPPTQVMEGNSKQSVQPLAPWGGPEVQVAQRQTGPSLRTVNYQGVNYRVYAVPDPNIADAAVVVAVPLSET